MKIKKYKKLLASLCALCCMFLWTVEAAFVAGEDASITVEYIYNEDILEDVEVEIFLIATWENGSYELTEDYLDLEIDFEALSSPSSWRDEGEVVEEFIGDKDCGCESGQYTDDTGMVTFSSLSYGVYYVSVADVTYEDGILLSSPVLLTVPSYDESANSYVYDIIMEPKVAFIIQPDDPDTPNNPKNPSDPDDPDDPDIPDIPEEPEIPDIPVIPDEPEIPDIPVIPDEPEIPQTGSKQWLVLPLGLLGSGCILLAIFGLGEKKEKR